VPIVVAGNYIQTASVTPAPPAALVGLILGGFLLTVAQHRKNKNLDILLRGYAELGSRGVFSGPLVIVGSEGPETPALYELGHSLGMQDRLIFINSISDHELNWLYANCSLFIACSSIEGYCLPVAEARVAQARVVCSDIPILREIGGAQCVYFSLAGNAVGNLVDAIQSSLVKEAIETCTDVQLLNSVVLEQYSKLYAQVIHGQSMIERIRFRRE